MKRTTIATRPVILILAFVASLFFASPEAFAHGGQFRPGDAVPPGLREPSDPTPPPPPPATGDPTPTPTTPPTTGPTRPTAPASPGATPPPATAPTGPTNTKRGKKGRESFADWKYWYHFNNADIENLKWALYRRHSSDNPLFATGAIGRQRGAETRWTEKRVQEAVVPALLWAMDPKNARHQDTESAAYIGLAKITRDPAHVPALMAGLDRDAGHGQIIHESAALGLGLLRRAHRSDQFSARELDRVRKRLFEVLEEDDRAARVRGFAALALGLLGDQPTGSGDYAGDRSAAETATTTRLFELLRGTYANPDLYAGLLMAIGMQSPDSILPKQREDLGRCALKGRLYREKASDLTKAYAALALGRIGTSREIRVLENVLTARRDTGHNVRRSAAIGLGQLARHVPGEERARVAKVLIRCIDRSKDHSTRNFAIVSLAYTLIEDLRSKETAVIGRTRASEVLLAIARKGSYMTRGYGALALGLVLRAMDKQGDTDLEAWETFREQAVGALRDGLQGRHLDPKTKAAFCVGTGIAKDARSRKALVAIVANRKNDAMLRGYAALALGLTGVPSPEISRAIADALRERSSEELRRQSAVALGLLGNPHIGGSGKDAVDVLLDELKSARTQSHKGQVVLSLARIGDHRAVDRLIEILKDSKEQGLTRALACAGLGLVGDMELIPSLARGSKNVNFRASTDLINEFLSIL